MKKKERIQEFIDPISSIRNLLGEERHIWGKSIESSDGTYIQYDNDGDIYFKTLSIEEYLEKIQEIFFDIIQELETTRSSWKMKLMVGWFLNMIIMIKMLKMKYSFIILMKKQFC